MQDDPPPFIDLAALAALLGARPREQRTLVAIAGPPGSGKSTLAERLVDDLNAAAPGLAALVPMDGFHFDDGLLEALGRRARKGAPDTFDVDGLRVALQRLRARTEDAVIVPLFDRAIEIARAGARAISRQVPIIVVEGNYLLLDEGGWRSLISLFDITAMIDTLPEELRRRLVERWTGYGLSPEQIGIKIDGNDMPNALRIITASVRPDFRIRN